MYACVLTRRTNRGKNTIHNTHTPPQTKNNSENAPSCGRFFSAFSFSCSVGTFLSQRARPLGMSSASLSLEEEESESESSHSESDPSSSCGVEVG